MESFKLFSIDIQKTKNSWPVSQIHKYSDYLALIILNFLTHYLFIGYFKFVSDDWSQIVYSDISIHSLHHLFFESQRTGQFVLTKIVVSIFGETAFGYHLMNFFTTTLLLLLVYTIFKDLLKHLFNNPKAVAFLGAVLFCLLFNKDELYSWATMFYDNLAYLLYFSSFYLFINSKKNSYNFYLSLVCYAGAVFIYEIGIFLPVLYCIFALMNKQNWKNTLYFLIPPAVYLIIRITNWFGYGWMYIDRTQNFLAISFISSGLDKYLHNLIASVGITIINPVFSVLGLAKLNWYILIALLIINLIISWILVKYFINPLGKKEIPEYNLKKYLNLAYFCFICILVIYIPISVHGIIQPRYLLFVDFFVVLLVILIAAPVIFGWKSSAIILIMLFTICLMINQGLYVNSIVSGEMQDSVNKAVFSHADEISASQYFYINSSDFFQRNPNYVFNIKSDFSIVVNQHSKEVYYPYLNTEGLARWSASAMMEGARINQSSTLLIYGDEGSVFVEDNSSSLVYKNTMTGQQYRINKSECFEGNSSNLLLDFDKQMKANWLFR